MIRKGHFSHPVITHHFNQFLVITAFGILVTIVGCGSTLKLKTTLHNTLYDVPMFGKTASREFTDSSIFSFPLKIDWEYDASAGFGNGSPVVVGEIMIIGTLQGELHAIDIMSGKRIKYIKNFSPISSSAVVFQKYVIFGIESSNENLISINTENGEKRWTQNVGGVASSPLITNDLLFVGGLDGKLYCIEALYGTKKWSVTTEAPIRSSPCSADGLVYCANTNGEVFALNIITGEQQWKYSTQASIFAGVTVSGGKLFVGSRDSSLYIFNARSGDLLQRIFVGDKIMSTPSVNDGSVFISSLDGSISSYRISDGMIRWRFLAKSAINTTPIITPEAIFVASLDQFLYALSPVDGTVLWKHNMGSRIKTTPLVWKNSLIIAAEDKNIYCFR